jgi:CubicO group peptidase (beta-lactamase class C family)
MNKNNSPFEFTENHLKKLLIGGVEKGVFPGAAAGVFYRNNKRKKKVISYYGNASLVPRKKLLKKNKIFDLASLTKPLATTLAILCLLKNKKIKMEETLPSLLQKNVAGEKSKITLRHLLSHSSGLPAHREYYKKLRKMEFKERKELLETWILEEELESIPGTKTVYSDLGFMLLGRIIESKSGESLNLFVDKKIMQPFGLENKIFFIKTNEFNKPTTDTNRKERFVATENCPWRKKVICGEVHDDNCYIIGGISGHCGLFGDIESVLDLCVSILDLWKKRKEHPNINNNDLQTFLSWQAPEIETSRVLGFDTPSAKESSGGRFLSRSSVGHLGFTGTSFWIDPEKELVIVLLSNRVHPNRDNEKIRKFRPFFHDGVIGKIFPSN